MKQRLPTAELATRSREILEAVVRLHIETGRPVSSGLVERSLVCAVSSATIRMVMKDLEVCGYLEQPHTSAGRLPTDRGFRVFVDSLCQGWSLRRRGAPARMKAMAARDIPRTLGAQDRLKLLARLLSKMTDNISIIVGPGNDDVTVERVEYFSRADSKGLLVVFLDTNQVRTGLVELPSDTPRHVVDEACRLLNKRVAKRTLSDIREVVLDSVDLIRTPVTECAERLVRQGRALLSEPAEQEIEVEGLTKLLESPELHEPESLCALLRFMDSPQAIRESLSRLNDRSGSAFGVWIGRENPVREMGAFSILTRPFSGGGVSGTLAVLGPRRMCYERAFFGIDVMREALSG